MSKETNSLFKVILNVSLAAAVCLGLFWGCEDDANTNIAGLDEYAENNPYTPEDLNITRPLITVEPSSITVSSTAHEFELTARGGRQPYSWAVRDSSVGTVRETSSQRAKYRPITVARNSITVTDRDGYVAIVEVNRITSAFSITPSSVNVITNESGSVAFTANGGVEPYGSWRNSRPDFGTINGASGLYTYANTAAGYNATDTISITDAEGTVATATVTFD